MQRGILRDFLGARKVTGNVNNRIKDTAEKAPGKFFVLNNGITLITKKADLDTKRAKLRIYGVSAVNGAQTTGACMLRVRHTLKMFLFWRAS
jgi:hypothetical protein